MSNEPRDSSHNVSVSVQSHTHFIWPLSKSPTFDEMNTSFGPRIDADRWDFHDGIDLPAPVGTPVYAMADGTVHRAGPADKTGPGQGFGSTHILLKVVDPTDGDDLFLVYLHLDSIAEGVIPGSEVKQGDLIGAVGQEDATYPHLHFEFRKGGPQQRRSVHPLHYLPYLNTANFRQLRLDRCNFYGDNGEKRVVRLRFAVRNRREGDVQAVHVELASDGVATRELHVDFDDRETINSDKGDEHAFKNGIAVEGYQKSNLKGEGLNNLHFGVLVEDITPEYDSVTLRVLDVKNEKPKRAEFLLPTLEDGKNPVDSREGFEDQTFPPLGWELNLLPGNVCRPDPAAVLTDSRVLLCQDFQSSQGTLIRAGLRFALPVDRSPILPMSWRLRAYIKPVELEMDEGLVIYPLALLAGDDLVAAACLRKIRNDEFVTGVLIRSADGLFREKTDVDEGKIVRNVPARWELDLIRLGTRQTTAVVRINNNVIARINGDTTSVEPDAACVGIAHRHEGLEITLHVDQLRLTEAPR
ncbi:MAG TPA: M23 family metallopeptidase [Candidatus Binatia bacterium]|nr:M23 family metallopeptidase [Candidatus Binatia bacterium]